MSSFARRTHATVQHISALVVVARPDDAEAFCGGTLAKLARAGNRVILVISTNGNRGSHERHNRHSR